VNQKCPACPGWEVDVTTYIQSFPTLAAVPAENLMVVEQRVTNTLLQMQMGNTQQDELKLLRNDVGFELGIVPPTIPGN
jgi:hypothetical protein